MMLSTTATELPRLMKCIGSRLIPASLPPDTDTAKREEGDAAHWLAREWFDGRITDPQPGVRAPNDHSITATMIDHVASYLEVLDAGAMEVDTSHSVEGSWEIRGRADHIRYDELTGTLVIDEFKYGWRIVEPFGNWTLISHAIGWSLRNSVRPLTVRLRVFQPRPVHRDGPMREWVIGGDTLTEYRGVIDRRLSNPTNELITSVTQCGYCHALATCPAARQASMNAVDAVGVAFTDELPDDALAFELQTMKMAQATLKNRLQAIEELMTHRIRSGNVIPGYALDQNFGHRAWRSGMTGSMLSALTGVDLIKDGIVTPAEAERRGVSKEVVAALTDRPMIGVKLVQRDATEDAARIFNRSE